MTRLFSFVKDVNSSALVAAEPPEAVEVESDFVVILAALLCALICVVGLIAVVRCAWLRRSGAANGQLGTLASANRGLKKKVLQSLPKFTYDGASAAGETNGKAPAECAICLTEYGHGDEIRLLPQCGHRFHVACIDTWLGSHSSCPSCRQILAVTRCPKCGEAPTPSVLGARMESELKARQDGFSIGFLPY